MYFENDVCTMIYIRRYHDSLGGGGGFHEYTGKIS